MRKPTKLAFGIGFAALVTGAAAFGASGALAWLLVWTSIGCGLSAAGYAWNVPTLHGKRHGRRIWWRAIPTAVFVAAFRIACALMRAWRAHPTASEVVPGVWVAGRVEASDLPADVEFVVDLVAEFSEPRAVRELPGYRFLPVLDGGVPPDVDTVLRLVEEVGHPDARVLVHCDSGMGRAPTFAALLLIHRGDAADVDTAIGLLTAARPFLHLGRADRAFLAQAAARVRLPAHAVAS